ncbi:MAG TPA: 50S ribosomal protein L24 [Candidatus Methanofastidiosa archaeon]|nr:50S ribosomal protein L24 [Candidatus Methanofastidiosa archaeon]
MVTKSPRKQRKMLFNMPKHRRHNLLTAPLSNDLKDKYGVKSMPIRKGDKVQIQRGDYVGHEGEVIFVDRKAVKIGVEGAAVEKTDGTEKTYPVHPSNVMITKLDLSDEMRKKSLEKKGW